MRDCQFTPSLGDLETISTILASWTRGFQTHHFSEDPNNRKGTLCRLTLRADYCVNGNPTALRLLDLNLARRIGKRTARVTPYRALH